ncbi:polyglutamine-binding protein 1 [Caerostris darwini]|uniref:Polyglutamine-binding protein 1 n=1 Tax=Caerostris darwini TaxID=1538125 RepID=A0AAV4RML0_9ARAC|nr:polyglutamine-binding protein 1 [Caerostris darwini]
MPLPAALLARLQKRGIVQATLPEVEEEVIAEDYDDNEKKTGVQEKIIHLLKQDRKRLLMLKKYPVPDGWEEVYDPGIGRHYYWNTQTNEVSWLPPSHPKSKISAPAEKLRVLIKDTFLEPMDEGDDQEQDMSESEDDSEEEENEPINEEKERNEKRPRKELARERFRGRPKIRENDLDPMDPAAYSEAPRGTWSSGLDRKGEAKTGADTTASGPLYQMRPYPSPGAVLRLNAEIKNKSSDDEEEEEE